MRMQQFNDRRRQIFDDYERLIGRPNQPEDRSNGVVQRWRHPVADLLALARLPHGSA